MFNLRPYQTDLTNHVFRSIESGNTLMVSETGSGKTVMFSYMALEWVGQFKRVYLCAHRSNICEQIGKTLASFGIQFGWLVDGHKEDTESDVIVAMVQRLYNRRDKLIPPDILVVDEAHHSMSDTYRKLFKEWPQTRICGATATPIHGSNKGLGEVFRHMHVGPTARELMRIGSLADFMYYQPPSFIREEELEDGHGDWTAKSAEKAANNDVVTGDSEKHYRKYLDGKPAIAFCATIKHCEDVAQFFSLRGWRCEPVHGKLKDPYRVIKALGDGELDVITSCDLISEGTDIPNVNGCIMLRKSKSLIVVKQQWGRVLRPKPDGSRAIILDHVGNAIFGYPDTVHNWSLHGKLRAKKQQSIKQCPQCYCVFPPQPLCPSCGHDMRGNKTSGGARKALTEVDGDLILAPKLASEDTVLFGDDVDLKTAVRQCSSLEEIQKLAKSRGYKPRWAAIQWRMKQHKRPPLTDEQLMEMRR